MRRPLVPTAALAVAAAGCGGGDGGERARTVTVDAGRPATVTGHEYRFDPGSLVVSGPLRLRFANEGSLAHNLRVLRGSKDVAGTPTFQGGSRSVSLSLPPGSYRIICTVGDHAELGMRGSLRVRARK